MKELFEKRNKLIDEMEAILSKAKTETRAFIEEETTRIEAIKTEIRGIDSTIKALEDFDGLEKRAIVPADKVVEDVKVIEERAFANYVLQKCGVPVELRAGEQNITMANNGAVIPVTIVNRIITTVKEMCPILQGATMFNVKGTLKIPVWGLANTTHDITVAFSDEFTELTADSGKITSVDLTGFLVGALTLIGKSVINNAEVDVVSIVVNEMSKKIALFLEGKLLNGQSSYNTGALATTNTMNAGSTSVISADNLIDLQAKIPTVYQTNSAWTMAPATFTAIRKLKDGNGQYLLQPSMTGATPYVLLGKPVYLSENMPAIGSANKAILYGDYSGLAVNMRENISIEILMEKYATQHAIGIVSWFEFDSKVMDAQKLATLVMSN
jgi:HK97 family phage major capsid protein